MKSIWRIENDLSPRIARASVLAGVDPNAKIPTPLAPPKSWFDLPAEMAARTARGEATPFTVVLDGPEAGRVYGDVAPKGQCILDGRPGCWTIPATAAEDDLAMSMNGVIETAEGETITVGVVPLDSGHAPDGTAAEAIDFMAHTGTMLAIVKYVHTPLAIAACGVLAPGVTWSDAVRARAAAQSGDWRALISEIKFDDGRPPQFRFTGSVAVNVPGLPLAVRLAAARNPLAPPTHGPALIIQEAPMTTQTAAAPLTLDDPLLDDPDFAAELAQAEAEVLAGATQPLDDLEVHTASAVYVLRPLPAFPVGAQVTFAGGARMGRVVDESVDPSGAPMLVIREAFDDGTFADDDADISVLAAECAGTGMGYGYEGDTSYPDDLMPELVVNASADAETAALSDMGDAKAPPFGSKKKDPKKAAAEKPCACHAKTAAIDNGGAPADPTVADPTNDILLERLDSLESLAQALSERMDTLEAAQAAGAEANSIAAALQVP